MGRYEMINKTQIPWQNWIIILITIFAILGIFLIPRIEQDLTYHMFADTNEWFGIPNFLNVISNFAFIIVALMGISLFTQSSKLCILAEIKSVYLIFFIALLLVGLGSTYYHLNPSNDSLIWDRLPITIAVMSLFTIILAEYVSVKLAKKLFLILLLFGIFSVMYWYISEQFSAGDLRLYILVQFLPMILIPLIVMLFPCLFTGRRDMVYLIVYNIAAKIAESFDALIYENLYYISGHSIKHILASIACYYLYKLLKNRSQVK